MRFEVFGFWCVQTPDREYIIHVSAMEIYNEVVRDLLNPDSGALRLLDDPDVSTKITTCCQNSLLNS